MIAAGQLRHHFWGDYRCTIAIGFDAKAPIDAVLALLGDGWQASEKNPGKAAIGHGDREWLETVKALFGTWGADVDKIDSCAKSIDVGEPFELEVPIPFHVRAEANGQTRLKL